MNVSCYAHLLDRGKERFKSIKKTTVSLVDRRVLKED